MDLRERRLEKGWSQEQLSDISGLSVRTVQRLERGERAGLETLKTLASIFEVSLSELKDHQNGDEKKETPMTDRHMHYQEPLLNREWKFFLIHVAVLMFVITWILVISKFFDLGDGLVTWFGFLWGMLLILHLLQTIGSSENSEKKDPKKDDHD